MLLKGQEENTTLVLFDDKCSVCSRLIKFFHYIGAPDRGIIFAGLQSVKGKEALKQYAVTPNPHDETIFVISGNAIYQKSDAIFQIFKIVGGIWFLALVFKILPKRFRDYLYTSFGSIRYHFGKVE